MHPSDWPGDIKRRIAKFRRDVEQPRARETGEQWEARAVSAWEVLLCAVWTEAAKSSSSSEAILAALDRS